MKDTDDIWFCDKCQQSFEGGSPCNCESKTTLEVTDIYIRNGILTARGKAPDPITGIVCDTEFNMNLGGVYAEAIMKYINSLDEGEFHYGG